MRQLFFPALFLLLSSCAAPHRPPPAAPEPVPAVAETTNATAEAPAEAAPEPESVPTECATNDGVCVPDAEYVKKLCSGNYPDVALMLMAKGSPFTRMYMRSDVDGWNADGGSSTRAKLAFDEEVLVLRKRAASTKGIVVGSGGGGYLVMRWDGNCYTLEDGEVTARKPPAAKNGPIPWRFYSERTRDALMKSAKVSSAVERRGKECKGATRGDVSKACEQADSALSSAVVAEIRSGVAIPEPERRP
jgi:hypothetical protein